MKTLIITSTVISILIIIGQSCDRPDLNEVASMELGNGWEMSQFGTEEWIPAEVPGCVHTDLLNNNKIEDPYYRLNEHDLQWIDKKDWVYRTSFRVYKKDLLKNNAELRFEGLDTYAEVYLNDHLILSADNMFRNWNVLCKDRLKEGDNKLEIIFRSPINKGIEKYDALPYVIPVSSNDLAEIGEVPGNKKVSIFTRKAGYHYGWDWGPRFVTSGIWKPIYLQTWNNGRIINVQIKQDTLRDQKAVMRAIVAVEADKLLHGELLVLNNDKILATQQFNAKMKSVSVEIPFEIENPKLWWPNGMGEQALYNLRIELREAGNTIQTKAERIGIRTVELIQDADQFGNTFHFKVNGRPVFMKGANYIPQDNFLNRVSPDRYEHVIQSAVDANMNMLRVWGGGIYEKDMFYDLCDEKGILVWQDFMFACAMFPGDSAFLENVKQEASDNIKRLRNHPSIALWCGNNENLSAWLDWGWKENITAKYGQEVTDIIWKAYEDVFHKILPTVVEETDSDRPYWSSSPSSAMGKSSNFTQGDYHYWGVWWGKEPFSMFKEKTGRFMSEYGFQSFPEMKTINSYATKDDWDIQSEVMKSHQRSSIGNETIELYMKRDYKDPKDFPSFIYVGQVLQGEAIKRAIELHRVQMPYCMGSLYWQIDDCWPVASWSGMDYYGRWKALHYMAKEAFKNVILVIETQGNKTIISTVSDLDSTLTGFLEYRILDFRGNILWEKTEDIKVDANTSKDVLVFNHSEIDFDKSQSVLEVSLLNEKEEIDHALWYYKAPKDLKLIQPHVNLETKNLGEGEYSLDLSSDVLVKNIYLEAKNADGIFSDNYFDLIPGKNYIVKFTLEEETDIPEFSFTELTQSF